MAKETAPEVAPQKETAPEVAPVPEQHNRAYKECKVDIETTMMANGMGGEKLRHHIGTIGKVIKTVHIEPKRADMLNRTWNSRRIIYWPADEKLPDTIKRSLSETESGEELWKDEPRYAATA